MNEYIVTFNVVNSESPAELIIRVNADSPETAIVEATAKACVLLHDDCYPRFSDIRKN